MRYIDKISCPIYRSDLFATMELEPGVAVWSNSERGKVSEFKVFPDSCGVRISLMATKKPVLIAGAYYYYGLRAYDALSGELLWERKDLRKVQSIEHSALTGLVAVAIEGGAMHILRSDTGETVRKLRDASAAYFASTEDEVLLTGKRDSVRMVSLSRGRTICRYPVSWGSIHAARNDECVLLTDSGYIDIVDFDDVRPIRPGSLLCYKKSGKLLWQVEAAHGAHFIRAAWSPEDQLWLAIEYANFTGGPSTLKAYDQRGELRFSQITGDMCEFLSEGKYLVTSLGHVFRLPYLEPLWTLSL